MRNQQECVRQVDHDAAQCAIGNYVVLVGVRSDDPGLSCCLLLLEDAETRSVCVLENYVSSARDLCYRLLLSRAHVVPVSYVRDHDFHFGIDRSRALLECSEALLDGRELSSADDSEEVRLRHSACNHTCQI